jgi:hypothetical protein
LEDAAGLDFVTSNTLSTLHGPGYFRHQPFSTTDKTDNSVNQQHPIHSPVIEAKQLLTPLAVMRMPCVTAPSDWLVVPRSTKFGLLKAMQEGI